MSDVSELHLRTCTSPDGISLASTWYWHGINYPNHELICSFWRHYQLSGIDKIAQANCAYSIRFKILPADYRFSDAPGLHPMLQEPGSPLVSICLSVQLCSEWHCDSGWGEFIVCTHVIYLVMQNQNNLNEKPSYSGALFSYFWKLYFTHHETTSPSYEYLD
jgi:hypothetical protein